MNSKLIFAFYKRIASVLGDPEKGGRLRWIRQDIVRLPIHRIDFNNPSEKAAHDKYVTVVEEMLESQKEKAVADRNFEDRRFDLPKRIEQLDAEIDQQVYAFYELTGEEIRFVEGKLP